MTYRSISRPLALLAAVAIVAAACGGTAQPSPTPAGTGGGASAAPTAAATPRVLTRPVEFVISTAPGGGSDIYARQWIAIMEKEKALSTSVLPVNKEGGAGAVAFTYVFEKKGDPHYIMVTLNSFFTTIITANPKLPYAATDFTPIANMALDPFFLWVNEDSPWKNAGDFVKAAQDKSITVAGTGSKQEDEVLFRRIQDLAKTKAFTYIPQSGGGAVATALAGHQGGVEATVNNPSEGLGLFTASPRKLRPLCAFTPDPPAEGAYKGLATCKSQGLDITDYYIVRSIVGPPGLTAAQARFWADAFKKVFDSADWKKFMSDNALNPDYKAGDDLKKLFEQYNQLHIDIAKKNGWT